MIIRLDEFDADLISALHCGAVKVCFDKLDGEERVMECSLSEDYIPKDKLPKSESKISSGTQVRVFDISKQEWRSFLSDRVKWYSIME